ncbi:MAG: FAD-dependent oxidoreductase, partial [Thermaurantiacus sp.]
SEIGGVDAGGVLTDAAGRRHKADLVVAADGVNSRIRDMLNLLESRRYLDEGAYRVLIPREPGEIPQDRAGTVVEWWSGRRRILYSACSATEVYAALVGPHADEAARRMPEALDDWIGAFPGLAGPLNRMRTAVDWDTVRWQRFQTVRLRRWSAGVVAVVGDAAHAMPPNLGQGGGCSMMNALALAVAVEDAARPVPEALAAWEAQERPLTDHTQRWAGTYSRLTRWPQAARAPVLWMMSNVGWLRRQRQRAERHHAAGTDGLGAA